MAPRSRARDQKIASDFGRRLKEVRYRVGITQEALAEAAELHPTYVSNVERGYSCPTIATVVRLAKALAVDAGELVAGIEP